MREPVDRVSESYWEKWNMVCRDPRMCWNRLVRLKDLFGHLGEALQRKVK